MYMCLICFFLNEILKRASTPLALLKIPECMIMQIVFISKVILLDTRCFLLYSKVQSQCMCTLSFYISHAEVANWNMIYLQSICNVTNYARTPAFCNLILNMHKETFHIQQINVKTFL